MKKTMTVCLLLLAAACTKETQQSKSLTASNQSDVEITRVYYSTDRCVLIAKDVNFLRYRTLMQKLDVVIENPYLDLHELSTPYAFLTPTQADALAKKLGFLNVADINAWWKQTATAYKAVSAKFGTIDNQTMTDSYILSQDIGVIPAACINNYKNCQIETSIKYNTAVAGCFVSSVLLTAVLTPLGGTAYMLGCGGLAIYARHGWLSQCANDYKTCMMPKVTLLPVPDFRSIRFRDDLVTPVIYKP